MAYFALLWKARTIEKYRSKYEKEKIDSLIAANAELPRHTFHQKWKLYRYDSEKKLHRTFRRWCPEGSRVSNFFVYLRTDQTFANFLVKSVIGFVGGIVLTYFWFMFFVFQLSISLIHATIMSSIIGVSLTLGLAFSYRIRCLVFLLIPQFFSQVGRYTLTCYALVLILTGPATNTLKNSEVLSESLACGQEQVKSSVTKISKSMEKPLYLMKDTIEETMKRLKYLAAKMKELMVKIHRLTMSIAHVLQSSLAWLNSVEDICNAKFGTPYDHCLKVLGQGTQEKITKAFANNVVKAVCFNLKSVDSMCVVGEFAKSSIVATVRKKLQTYTDRVGSTVSASVRVRRSHGCCNASRTASQAAAGIVTEIRHRADPLLTWLSWSSCLTSLFLLLIIFRAKYYQQMFETRSRFDNRYVTKELRDLDLKRLRQGRETVLPLNSRERAKYVSTTSFRLLASERVHLTRSIVFMVITTFKLLIHMVADYSLYWVLMNIRFHGRFQTPLLPGDPTAGIHVAGSGPLAGMVRVLVEALSIPLAIPAPSPISCLPNPHPPDFQRYAQIGVLILLLWLFALFEPYGLRLRHVITGHYQPERARARAEWLYNHIIRTRGCFLKYARRKLHREYKYSSEERYTFKRWLNNFIPCRCLRLLLRIGPEEPHCLLCGTKQIQNDSDTHLKRCDTPSCPGTYCYRCFMDIGQLCTICLSPEDYGDLSDVSLEKSSSEGSDSDDSDSDQGVNKPLIGASARGTNEDENFYHRNPGTNSCERLSKLKNNGNKEATTSNFDSLKQKNDTVCDFNQKTETEDEDKISDNKSTIPVVVRDKENLLKSVQIPKEKLSGVINTMKLLTTKIQDDKHNNKWNMHESKTFEYLVMNLMQPVDAFKKALVVRQTKHTDSRLNLNTDDKKESMKQLIPFLCNYSVNNVITNEVNDPVTSNLNVDNQPELDINNEHVTNKNPEMSKRNSSSIIRNIETLLLETKKIEPKDLFVRLRKRRIYLSTNFIYKKQRRHKKRHSYLSIKTTCSFRPQIKTKCRIYNINKASFSKNLPKKVKKFLSTNKYVDNIVKCLVNNNVQIQDTKCHTRNKTQQLSNNIVTDCSSNIKPSDLKYSNVDEGPNEMINKKKPEENVLKTTECKTEDKQYEKRGFYSRLWMQIKKTLTKQTFTTFMQKHDPILSNIVTNHKRRKKYLMPEQKEIINITKRIAKLDNDDARNFRISLYLKDHQEWFKRQFQKDSKVLDYKTETRQPNERINNFLLNLKEKADKRKIKEAEIKMKVAQKELVNKLKLKAKAEEKLKRKLKKETIRHKGNKNLETVNQTLKVNQCKPNKNQTRPIRGDKTIVMSSASVTENYIRPVIDETSLKGTHTYPSPPQICMPNRLNFFGFDDPLVDLPDESIDLDKIFGDEDDECETDFKENNVDTELIYYHNKRKHPQRPLLWPGIKNYTTQTPPKDERVPNAAVAKEKLLHKTPSLNIHNKREDSTRRQNVIRPGNKPAPKKKLDGCNERKGVKTTNTQVEECKMKNENKEVKLSDFDFDGKIGDQNEEYENKNMHENKHRYQNIWSTFKNNKTQTSFITKVVEPTAEGNDNCLEKIQSNQKNKKNVLPVRLSASDGLFGMKGPVDRFKGFYGTLRFGKNEKKKILDEKEVSTSEHRDKKSPNKKIQVQMAKFKNCDTQCCADDYRCEGCDVLTAVSSEHKCTCATQYSVHQHQTNRVSVGTMHHNAFRNSPNEDTDSTTIYSDSPSAQSETEETKSDTTICSVVQIDYAKERPPKHRRNSVKVITKANQSTITDNVRSVDVSTVTSDWWSPLVEKKVVLTRNRRQGTKNQEKGDKINTEMETDGKCVSFKSYAQIIPRDKNLDIMSPCRYLLEVPKDIFTDLAFLSQRYYNELFSTGICTPSFFRKLPVPKEDKGTDALGVGHRTRKSLKTKRLEDSYSPRKRVQTSQLNLRPVTWRPAEKKDSPSQVFRSRRNSNVQAGRMLWKLRDSQDKGIGKVHKRNELLHSRSFTKHGEDAGQCNLSSSYY